jgi:hypothetical protein
VWFDSQQGQAIFLLPKSPDWFLSLPSLLFKGYRDLFRGEKIDNGVKVTVHAHLMPRLGTGTAVSPPSHMPSWWQQDQISFAATKEKWGDYYGFLTIKIRMAEEDRNITACTFLSSAY